jgi:large subunit ribosomal protein L24
MPVNPARHARHLKQVKKVQDAIRYRDKTLEKLQPIKKKKFETKQYFIQQNRVRAEVTHANIRTARNNAREDWDLGPLRPNRAVGEEAETRGIYNREGLRDVPLPKHWLDSGDEVQRKVKTRLPENVLRNQWPIVEGDRVVIIRGLHKNKIGVVKELHKNENMVTVDGLNKVCEVCSDVRNTR